MQRAFSLKGSYMTAVLNEYILNDIKTYRKLVPALHEQTLDQWILEKMNAFHGLSTMELARMFELDSKAKSRYALLASRMLNGSFDNAEKSDEFQKAKIKLKTIRVGKNGKLKQEMSFPAFKYTEIVEETWEESELREMFETTRYLFLVFRGN